MVWVKFSRRFRWVPSDRKTVTVKYKGGSTANVTRACAREAIAAGKAEKVSGRDGKTSE